MNQQGWDEWGVPDIEDLSPWRVPVELVWERDIPVLKNLVAELAADQWYPAAAWVWHSANAEPRCLVWLTSSRQPNSAVRLYCRGEEGIAGPSHSDPEVTSEGPTCSWSSMNEGESSDPATVGPASEVAGWGPRSKRPTVTWVTWNDRPEGETFWRVTSNGGEPGARGADWDSCAIAGWTVAELFSKHQGDFREAVGSTGAEPLLDNEEKEKFILESFESAAVQGERFQRRQREVLQSLFAPLLREIPEGAGSRDAARASGGSAPSRPLPTVKTSEEFHGWERRVNYGPVLTGLREIGTRSTSGWASWGLLIGSLIVFVGGGLLVWHKEFVLWLIPILLLHELGHFGAMRWFRYKNVQMFFIPFLGAAVSGRHFNVPGWKKCLVYFAGPVPGIVLAIPLAWFYQQGAPEWVRQAALMLVVINVFNLIPLLPLDGGWIMHSLFFNRQPVAEALFRIGAAGALIGGGIWMEVYFLVLIGVLMLLAVPTGYLYARVARQIRLTGTSGMAADSQEIPAATAVRILDALPHTGFRQDPRQLAQATAQIFEMLNSHPPGWLVTVGLLLLYGLSWIVSAGIGYELWYRPMQAEVEEQERWNDMALQPVAPPIVLTYPVKRTSPRPSPISDGTRVWAARWLDPAEQEQTWRELEQSQWEAMRAGEWTIGVVNELELGGAWEAFHQKMMSDATEYVTATDFMWELRIAAPNPARAVEWQAELEGYQAARRWCWPSAPWDPERSVTPAQQTARRALVAIEERRSEVRTSSRYTETQSKLRAVLERGGEASDYAGSLRDELLDLELRGVEALLPEAPEAAAVIGDYLRLARQGFADAPDLDGTAKSLMREFQRALGSRGELPIDGLEEDWETPDDYGLFAVFTEIHGSELRLRFLHCCRPITGITALANYYQRQGATNVKLRIETAEQAFADLR